MNIEKNLSIEYGFPSGTHLMGILRIHLMIYSPECSSYGLVGSPLLNFLIAAPTVIKHVLLAVAQSRRLPGALS